MTNSVQANNIRSIFYCWFHRYTTWSLLNDFLFGNSGSICKKRLLTTWRNSVINPYGTMPINKQLSGLTFEDFDLSFTLWNKNRKLNLDKTILKSRKILFIIRQLEPWSKILWLSMKETSSCSLQLKLIRYSIDNTVLKRNVDCVN